MKKSIDPLKNLQQLLKKNKVIPIIGSGVSTASAGIVGWKGLIENGIKYAEIRNLDINNNIAQIREQLSINNLTRAAFLLKVVLNAPNHPFSEWLEYLFGNVQITSKDLLNSITDLCCPVLATTNYDTLADSFSKIERKKVFDWTEHRRILRSLSNNEEFILHLHGIWDKPETLIFGEDDYQKLKKQKGYKSVLQKMWVDYHFLFIGCSKEGVMDEDFITLVTFLNEWFPDFTHPHYILLPKKSIDSHEHIELLTKCNIEAICFGNEYNQLPDFINKINPNQKKLIKKAEQYQIQLQEKLEQITLKNGKISSSTKRIDSFLQNVLPNDWIDSREIKLLEKALEEVNENVRSKKEQLINYQNFSKGLLSVSELAEKVDLWNKNWDRPSQLDQSSFITTAIFSYECLNHFPKTLLNDIELRKPSTVHSYYLNGYLGRFIAEYKNLKNYKQIDLEAFYKDDKYFFENLKRIIMSLHNLLSLNPNDVFEELPAARLTKKLNKPFLLFIGDSISIRDANKTNNIYASLPSEKNLEFVDAEYISHNNESLIIGYNSSHCFFWNPTKHFIANPFHCIENDYVIKIVNSIFDKKIISTIITQTRILTFKNFKLEKEVNIEKKIYEICHLKVKDMFWGITSKNENSNDEFLFRLTSNGKCVTLLSFKEIWNTIKNIPVIENTILTELKLENCSNVVEHPLFPFITKPEIQSVIWNNRETISIKLQLNFITSKDSLIVILDIENNHNIIQVIYFHKRSLFVLDSFSTSNSNNLICGYLDVGGIKKLVQLLKDVPSEKIVHADFKNQIIPSNKFYDDILFIKAITQIRAFAIQDNNKVFDISLKDLSFTKVNISKKESIRSISAYLL